MLLVLHPPFLRLILILVTFSKCKTAVLPEKTEVRLRFFPVVLAEKVETLVDGDIVPVQQSTYWFPREFFSYWLPLWRPREFFSPHFAICGAFLFSRSSPFPLSPKRAA